jgi:hypothetical protein
MKQRRAPSYPVSIFIAGDAGEAKCICRAFCDEEGLCVTVTATCYVYKGGYVSGVIVGLINYPRFPAEPAQIETKAIELGMKLRDILGQESFSVQTPTTTTWFSWREADLAIADTHRNGGDGTKIAAPFMSSGGAKQSPKTRSS